jgi:16S rRNA (guanine527-N7)-methyltransferase
MSEKRPSADPPKRVNRTADEFPKNSGAEAFAAHFGVSPAIVTKLERYEKLLRQWQRAVNLVAASSLDDVWHRHFADSAQLLALAPEAKSWLDLGSGAGFPGMVIAILLSDQPGVKIQLIEAQQRKCAFLAEVARATGAPVEISQVRVEAAGIKNMVVPPDIITARALAPLDKLLELAAPWFGPRTRGLFLKGEQVQQEIETARRRWTFHVKLATSETDRNGRIAEIRAPHLRD